MESFPSIILPSATGTLTTSWTQNWPKAVNKELKMAGLLPKLNSLDDKNLAGGNGNPSDAVLGLKKPEIKKKITALGSIS